MKKEEENIDEDEKIENYFNKNFDIQSHNIILNFLSYIDKAVLSGDEESIDYYISRYKVFINDGNNILPTNEEEYEEFFGV